MSVGFRGGPAAFTALLLGSATFLILEALTGLRGIGALGLLAGLEVSSLAIGRASAILKRGRAQQPSVRIAVIGGAAVAERLRSDLGRASHGFEFAGRIAPPGDGDGSVRALAELDGLRQAVVEHDIGLLILSSSAPRLLVSTSSSLLWTCLWKLVELPSFYEAVFGYVPISEMNVVWFQYLVDRYSRLPHRLVKRAIDLFGAAVLAVPALPHSAESRCWWSVATVDLGSSVRSASARATDLYALQAAHDAALQWIRRAVGGD